MRAAHCLQASIPASDASLFATKSGVKRVDLVVASWKRVEMAMFDNILHAFNVSEKEKKVSFYVTFT